MVPNFESVVGALHTHHEGGRCGDGIHHLYAQTLGTKRLVSMAAITIRLTPLQWISAINVAGDAATTQYIGKRFSLEYCSTSRPYCPCANFLEHYQVAPIDVQEWWQEQAGTSDIYGHPWGPNYGPDLGSPLECFNGDQQRTLGSPSHVQPPRHDVTSGAVRTTNHTTMHTVYVLRQRPSAHLGASLGNGDYRTRDPPLVRIR